MFRIVCAGLAGLIVIAPASMGQELNSAAERTAACLEIEAASERLACFENAATALSDALKAPAPAPAPASPAPAPATAAATEAPAQPDAPKWAAAPEPEPQPAPQTASAATEDEDSTPIWARVFKRDESKDQVDQINVSVTRIMRNTAGRHFFVMDDGQEWEQTMPATVRPPKGLPAAATIEEALVGSPRLTFDDGPSGAYKVRRVK